MPERRRDRAERVVGYRAPGENLERRLTRVRRAGERGKGQERGGREGEPQPPGVPGGRTGWRIW